MKSGKTAFWLAGLAILTILAPSSPVAALPGQDLEAVSLTNTPSMPRAGQLVHSVLVVHNAGDLPSGPFHVKLEVRGVGQDHFLLNLLPGESAQVVHEWVPSAPGGYMVHGLIDPNNDISESDETNNRQYENVTVLEAATDLTVSNLFFSPMVGESYLDGEDLYVNATIANQGTADAGPFMVRFFVDGSPIGGDTAFSGLLAGSITHATTAWRMQAGDHVIEAIADADNAVAESIETNNGFSRPISVTPVVRGLELSPPSQTKTVAPGATVSFYLTIRNTGEAEERVEITMTDPGPGWSSYTNMPGLWLGPGQSAQFEVQLGAPNSGSTTVTVTALSYADPDVRSSSELRAKVRS